MSLKTQKGSILILVVLIISAILMNISCELTHIIKLHYLIKKELTNA